jgi:two-component system, response regulator PdtaR
MAIGVLVVEDEFLLRMDAVEFMKDSGFTVYEASNADEAIALLEMHRDIRAVFTDIHMPGSMDGLKLAHYVRRRWPPVKLIITSGQAKPRPEEMPVGSGYVGKPYQLDKVTDSLRAMIG